MNIPHQREDRIAHMLQNQRNTENWLKTLHPNLTVYLQGHRVLHHARCHVHDDHNSHRCNTPVPKCNPNVTRTHMMGRCLHGMYNTILPCLTGHTPDCRPQPPKLTLTLHGGPGDSQAALTPLSRTGGEATTRTATRFLARGSSPATAVAVIRDPSTSSLSTSR